ncbi:MAG: NADH-quinone oxidoreductase subunit J [Akkermansiaceae bacterium]
MEHLQIPLFWLFSTIMLVGACAVIAFRNPVSSALAMVTSFVGLAALFIGLSAFFVGVIQILVYSGAIMVLFLFIIMLLDLKDEKRRTESYLPLVAGLALVGIFFIQLVGVLSKTSNKTAPPINTETLAASKNALIESGRIPEGGKIAESLSSGKLPDIHLIGQTLFTDYNLPLQILGILLLVATVGVVVLSKRQTS